VFNPAGGLLRAHRQRPRAAPPRAKMNSRRRMCSPPARSQLYPR
jgi:hypothetical protein